MSRRYWWKSYANVWITFKSQRRSGKMRYRVLSLDGGGQLEMTSTLLMSEIEKQRPGFLARTDMIAGTSAGAMVALILATQDDPAHLLPQAEMLWEKFFELSMNSLAGALLGLE